MEDIEVNLSVIDKEDMESLLSQVKEARINMNSIQAQEKSYNPKIVIPISPH